MICVCAEDSNRERTVWLLPVSCRHLCGFTLCPKMCEVGCLRPSAGSIETLVPLPSSSSPLDGADAIMQRAVGRVLSALGYPLPTGCLWQWIHWLINSVGWSTDWGAGWAKGQWAGRAAVKSWPCWGMQVSPGGVCLLFHHLLSYPRETSPSEPPRFFAESTRQPGYLIQFLKKGLCRRHKWEQIYREQWQ